MAFLGMGTYVFFSYVCHSRVKQQTRRYYVYSCVHVYMNVCHVCYIIVYTYNPLGNQEIKYKRYVPFESLDLYRRIHLDHLSSVFFSFSFARVLNQCLSPFRQVVFVQTIGCNQWNCTHPEIQTSVGALARFQHLCSRNPGTCLCTGTFVKVVRSHGLL